MEVGQENCSWWSRQDLTNILKWIFWIPEPTCVTARAHGTALPEGDIKAGELFQNSPSGAKSLTKSHLNVGDGGAFQSSPSGAKNSPPSPPECG